MKIRQKESLVSLACLLSLICLVGSAFAANLVINGDFEAGYSGFSSDYTKQPPGDIYDQGVYIVGGNPYTYHSSEPGSEWASFGPQNGSLMMIVNGAAYASDKVWAQTVMVAPNSTYYFSTWVASSSSLNPAILDFSINNASIGSLTASTTTGLWELFSATWDSGVNTTAALSIVDQNILYVGNDFCLDNIKLDTDNPVPLPGAVWLLGSGLLGLAALGRRRTSTMLKGSSLKASKKEATMKRKNWGKAFRLLYLAFGEVGFGRFLAVNQRAGWLSKDYPHAPVRRRFMMKYGKILLVSFVATLCLQGLASPIRASLVTPMAVISPIDGPEQVLPPNTFGTLTASDGSASVTLISPPGGSIVASDTGLGSMRAAFGRFYVDVADYGPVHVSFQYSISPGGSSYGNNSLGVYLDDASGGGTLLWGVADGGWHAFDYTTADPSQWPYPDLLHIDATAFKGQVQIIDLEADAVPLPPTVLLLATGLLAMLALRHRRAPMLKRWEGKSLPAAAGRLIRGMGRHCKLLPLNRQAGSATALL